jgi:poly-beta-1,6-N-acetyl-D-glucosamine N-deacetylase
MLRWARTAGRPIRALALFMAFALPVYVFIKTDAARQPPRVSVPIVAAADVPSLPVVNYSGAVPVLVYHDISQRPGRFTVSPLNFARQMATLRHAGFQSVSAAQFLAFLHGTGTLPEHAVLITFDDGLGSEWRVADPILQRYGFRAMAFVISGQLGQHGYYYLHPDELRAMVRSGRWDIEAHTHLAHLLLQIDADGHDAPALLNRLWLPRLRRIETEAEYRSRVMADLAHNVAVLRSYGANPVLFAYPFSAARTPTNDRRLVRTLHTLVKRRFAASFIDAKGGRFVTRYDRADKQELPRIEVYRSTTALDLLRRLNALAPAPPLVHDFAQNQQWVYEGSRGHMPPSPVGGTSLSLKTAVRHWLAAYYAPSRTQLWTRYRLHLTVIGLGTPTSGTSATVILGNAVSDRAAITLSAGRVTGLRYPQNHHAKIIRQLIIRPASLHRLKVDVDSDRLRVTVDGRANLTFSLSTSMRGGIGFAVWRETAASPSPLFSGLRVSPLARSTLYGPSKNDRSL